MSGFRKPTTTNPRDFWHIKQTKWDAFEEDVALGGPKKRAAMANLRKFDAAGRIMETDEGKDALTPCFYCTREHNWVPCKVFSTRGDVACAYCKLYGRSGCKANLPKQESDSDNEPMDDAVARARIDELQKEVASLNERVRGLEGQLSNLLGFFNSYQQWTT